MERKEDSVKVLLGPNQLKSQLELSQPLDSYSFSNSLWRLENKDSQAK